MKRNNPVCVYCGRQISVASLRRGDGAVLEQAGGQRRGEHRVPGCAQLSLQEIRKQYEDQQQNAAVAQG